MAGTVRIRKHSKKGVKESDIKTFTVDDNSVLLGKKKIKGRKILDHLETGHHVSITHEGTHALTIKKSKKKTK